MQMQTKTYCAVMVCFHHKCRSFVLLKEILICSLWKKFLASAVVFISKIFFKVVQTVVLNGMNIFYFDVQPLDEDCQKRRFYVFLVYLLQ